MRRQLTWSIVADGGTDRLLIPNLQWAIHRLDPEVEILRRFIHKQDPTRAMLRQITG